MDDGASSVLFFLFYPRCSMAAAPSSPTSTPQQTRCTARRDSLSPPTDMSWLRILATTASKSTATCSSSSSSSAHKLYGAYKLPRALTRTETGQHSSAHPFIFEPCRRRAICLTVPHVNERQRTESSVV